MLKDISLDDFTLANMEMLRRAAVAQMPRHDDSNDRKPLHVLFLIGKKGSRGDAR